MPSNAASASQPPIAIIGLSCRFPGGASTPERLWSLLRSGEDAVGTYPEGRWDLGGFYHPEPGRPGRSYTTAAACLSGLEEFDADFFGISPVEASRVSPNQRLMLELAWEAIEDAGRDPTGLAGSRTGVFVGLFSDDYGERGRSHLPSINAFTNAGGAYCISANRVSYALDLRGPSLSVDDACASALVALHLACTSLRAGECDAALVGGINTILNPGQSVGFAQAAMLSRNGRCQTFSADGDGFVRAEGAAVVLLKPLARALADGDPVRAVIAATGMNQNGRTAGISNPSQRAQADLLAEVLARSGLDPELIGYVEAHGTGTRAGDPAECGAIGSVLGRGRSSPLLVGSIKSNLGHTEGAAGLAGVLKIVLAMEHRLIPANLHAHSDRLNPGIDFAGLNLQPVLASVPWPEGRPAAGVSSFGFGGANAHALLLPSPHAPAVPAGDSSPRPLPVLVSGRTPGGLANNVAAIAACLREAPAVRVADIAFTLGRHRARHDHRIAVVASDAAELEERLTAAAAGDSAKDIFRGRVGARGAPEIAFAFCGNGPQWWGMGRGLIASDPAAAAAIAEIDALFAPRAGWSLRGLFALDEAEAGARMARTEIAQPALFALQVAVAGRLLAAGVRPRVALGHSVGEVAAAWCAGRYDLATAVRVIHERSRTQAPTRGSGGMLAAGIDAAEAERQLGDWPGLLHLAAVNGPASVTIAGATDAIAACAARLQEAGCFARVLPLAYAFHSPHMDPIADALAAGLAGLSDGGRGDGIRFVSTVAGHVEEEHPRLDAAYWWENVRRPVHFAAAVERILSLGIGAVVEIGPHPVLRAYLGEIARARGATLVAITTLRRDEPEDRALPRTLAGLAAIGHEPDWAAAASGGRRIRLPAYAWDRQRHWHFPEPGGATAAASGGHPLLGASTGGASPAWQAVIDLARAAWLRDHQVQGAVVFPGAGFVALGLAAARALHPDADPAVDQVEIAKALVLDADQETGLEHRLDGDGRLLVHARRGEQPWQRHAAMKPRAALAGESAGRIDPATLRAALPRVLSADEHYRACAAAGLAYGAAFRGIAEVHLGAPGPGGAAESCLVRLVRPADGGTGIDPDPALLDACFQAVLGLVAADAAGQRPAMLPVRLERVVQRRPTPASGWAHLAVRRRRQRQLVVDLIWADDDGAVCLHVEGLRFQAFPIGGERGLAPTEPICLRERWLPAPLPGIAEPSAAADLPAPSRLAAACAAPAAEIARDLDRARAERDARPAFRAATRAFVVAALAELGWRPAAGETVRSDELARRLAVAPDQVGLLGRHLDRLAEDGLLEPAGPAGDRAYRVAGAWTVQAAADPLEGWRRLAAAWPSFHAELLLLLRAGMHHADVLRGRRDPLALIFAERSSVAEHLFDSSPWVRAGNRLVAAAVAEMMAALPAQRVARMIEVGAGTGGGSAHVLPELPPERSAYLLTDPADGQLARLRQRFADLPQVRTASLDLARDLAGQGMPAGGADAVLAMNAMHAMPDRAASLGRIRELLAPGGLLLLLECTSADWHDDLVFGAVPGWRPSGDAAPSAGQPALDHAGWKRALAAAGFAEVERICADPGPGIEPTQSLIVARAPTAIAAAAPAQAWPEGDWLVYADAGGLAERAIAVGRPAGRIIRLRPGPAMAANGPDAFAVRPGDPADLAAALAAAGIERIAGVVHAWGCDAAGIASEAPDAWSEAGEQGVGSLLDLAQRLAGTRVRLLVCTRGAVGGGALPGCLAAPAWGFARCLAHEHPEFSIRCIDLDPEGEDGVHALLAELASPADPELETCWRGGHRRSVRLVQDAPSALLVRPGGCLPYRIESEQPGQLEALRAMHRPSAGPGPGEVEIAVDAAGMNYKDLMLSMGLLSDEVIEGGYCADALGLECAGAIVAVGPGVTGFAAGDPVYALGRHSYGTRCIASAEAVLPRPAHLAAEAAAALPCVYLSAHYGLVELGRLSPGETVLVHGGAGGVGAAAIHVARACGARVFATAGSEEKRDWLRGMGCEGIFDSRSLEFVAAIRAATGGEGVDAVLNSLAGDALVASVGLLKPFGRFLELGKRDFMADHPLGLAPFARNLSFSGIDVDRLIGARPGLCRRILGDIARRIADGTYPALPHRVFPASHLRAALRQLQQSRHIGKLVLDMRDPHQPVTLTADDGMPVRPDGAYLVTGGLGGFGLASAKALAARGARNLILVSRRGPAAPEAAAALAELAAAGVRVLARAVDAADPRALAETLAEARSSMPPLRGILHAAMVLDDRIIANLDHGRLANAMRPKIAAAWHLHRLTRGAPLDWFICYSSVAAMVGNPGQAGYVAANQGLDALMQARRASGLPGLSVQWGVIGGAGYVARTANAATEQQMLFRTMQPIPAESCLALLPRAVAADPGTIAIARIDWSRWRAGRLPRFAHLMVAAGADATPEATADLAGLPPEALAAALAKRVASHLGRIIGMPPDRVDPQRTVADLGLDSLMTVELSLAIKADTGQEISAMALMQGMTVEDIVRRLLPSAPAAA